MYGTYQPLVAARLGVPSPLTASAAYAIAGDVGAVGVHVEVTAALTTAQNVVRFVVVEDGAHSQVNLARATAEDTELTATQPGQTQDVTRTFTVAPEWDPERLGVVVFVQSLATREVVQAALAVPDYAGAVAVDAAPDGLDAPWRLTFPGGQQLDGHGDRTLAVFEEGTYTLAWRPVEGWTQPAPAQVAASLAEGDTVRFAGTYGGGPFSVVTAGPLGASGPARGVSLPDYDGDGDPDLLVAQYNAPSRLLRNDGGTFVEVAVAPFTAALPATAAAWADFDNDGDLDAYLALDGQANRLLLNSGGAFTDVAAASLVADAGAARAAAWADYDVDGKLDLLVINDAADNKLYRGFGDPGIGRWLFFDVSPSGGDTGHDVAAVWADYDADGDPDYYLSYRYAPNKLLQNNGTYGFWDMAGSGSLADPGPGQGVAWGDYDGDGDLDLYLANDGSPDVLLANDHGAFSLVIGDPLGDTGRGRCPAWGDWDNDGDLDLYVTRRNQPDLFLRNDGAGGFVSVPPGWAPTDGNGAGCAWGDVDEDGDLDLYLANDGGPGALLVNGNQGNGNHWLAIDLVGVTANRSAVGAGVRVVAGGKVQLREIAAGGGFGSQNALTAYFGLGAAAEADTVQVRWPGGGVQTFRRVDGDRRLTVRQDQVADAAAGGSVPAAFALHACAPNPFNPATTVRFELPAPARARLAVYAVDGRRVRVLRDGDLPAGAHVAVWDGRDDRGGAAASGVYFFRLEAGPWRATTRAVLVK